MFQWKGNWPSSTIVFWECRFGPGAGEATEEVMSTIGFVFATVWTATKLRKAVTPSNLKPTRKGMLKAAAKASLGRPNEWAPIPLLLEVINSREDFLGHRCWN
jgi:hypothetical protein